MATVNTFSTTTTINDDSSGLSTGMMISIIYGAAHIMLLLILSIHIYIITRKKGESLSFKKFLLALWKERGVYAPLLIHIYDTATDVGVLVEWYKLAQIERNGENLESLDMEQFFWIAVAFMIVYRFLLGLMGAVLFRDEFRVYLPIRNKTCRDVTAVLIGFILGSLELVLFIGIFIDFKQKKKEAHPEPGAGEMQKVCQSSEGVLESLPEVIMQSVFYMRAINDDRLNAVAGDIVYLVAFSIAASLLSITSKYIWVDMIMVRESARSLIMKKNDRRNDGVLMVNPCCMKGYDVSFGYIVRVTWRLAAVTARFVIIALIWVVLGGAIEFILLPLMVILWYILILFYASGRDCKAFGQEVTEFFAEQKRSFSADTHSGRCAMIVFAVLIFIFGFIGGLIFQLGIAVVSGAGIYIIRIVENFILMSVITVFALFSFECAKCADAQQRLAFGADGNKRILTWIVVGWLSVFVHAIMSCLMPKVMDPDYEFDFQSKSQKYRYKQMIFSLQTQVAFEARKDVIKLELAKAAPIDASKIRVCECGEKFIPMKAGWCFSEWSGIQYDVRCCYKEGCGATCKGEEIVYYCQYAGEVTDDSLSVDKHSKTKKKYVLCDECVVKGTDPTIDALDELLGDKNTQSNLSIPICICGNSMIVDEISIYENCSDCKIRFYWNIWKCPEESSVVHIRNYYLCVECGAKNEHLDRDKAVNKRLKKIRTMLRIKEQVEQMQYEAEYEAEYTSINDNNDIHLPYCVCGRKLEPWRPDSLSDQGGRRKCVKCRNGFDNYEMIWCCEQEVHPSGYYLCVDCGPEDVDTYYQQNVKEQEKKQMEEIEEEEIAGRTETGMEMETSDKNSVDDDV